MAGVVDVFHLRNDGLSCVGGVIPKGTCRYRRTKVLPERYQEFRAVLETELRSNFNSDFLERTQHIFPSFP